MGQIESTDSQHNHNNSQTSDRKEIIANSLGNDASNDTKIKFDDNSNKIKDPDQSDATKKEEDPRLKKAKTCDFACTIFYAMVAMLLFSSMSHTYNRSSGGGCGHMYGVQTLLAYTCVGLACAIIRSLRKHIKEEINGLTNDEQNVTAEEDSENNSMNYKKFKDLDQSTDMVKKEPMEKEIKTEVSTKPESILINLPYNHVQPYSGQDRDKLSTGLPLPALPPLNPSKPFISKSNEKSLSVLSAADLKTSETKVRFQENPEYEKEYPYPVLNNEWNQLVSNRDAVSRELGSHRALDRNWNEYNLNSIDKYI